MKRDYCNKCRHWESSGIRPFGKCRLTGEPKRDLNFDPCDDFEALPPHVTQLAWDETRKAEGAGAIHPCTHWNARRCMCKGSCSCHWEQKK